MMIYIFVEHYPNPYKPQIDTELAYFIRNGHEIKIFASGRYFSTLHPKFKEYDLINKAYYVPTTLSTTIQYFPKLIAKTLRYPFDSLQRLCDVYCKDSTIKVNFMRFCKAQLLPRESPDLCYIHNIVTADVFDFIRNIYPASRVLMYFHGGEVGGVKRVLRDAKLFKSMDTVLTNTNFSLKQAINRGSLPNRTFVLPVGHDLTDYPATTKKCYRKGGILRLISIGRISEEKGLHISIEAIAKLVNQGCRGVHYTIVGKGKQEAILKELVLRNRLENYVKFIGELDKPSVVSELEKSDVLILPSITTDTWAETQANVVQEAMFMRLPVITTISGGVPESIPEIFHQFSVPENNSQEIVLKIIKMLSLHENEMIRLGEIGREFAVNNYNIENIVQKTLDFALRPAMVNTIS